MDALEGAARAFLQLPRLAVAGVSRRGDTAANAIFRKLRDGGRTVYAVNPHTDTVEGGPCHHSLADIPGGVDGLIIGTPPAAAEALVRDCAALGIRHVWLHRSFGAGSMSAAAVALCVEHGISVIPGSCPMMFLEPVDLGHRCFRWWFRVTGAQPVPLSIP